MLYVGYTDTIDGVQIYGDNEKFNKFYVLPEQPRFRLDEKGRPIFKFLKYRFPIDRPDGRKGGGYVVFDVEFTTPEEKLARIKEALQPKVRMEAERRRIGDIPPVEIGTISYKDGTAQLNIGGADGVLVQRISQAGKPSLFGKNISTYSLELTPEGATFFEQALQGQGGFVSVIYDLTFPAKLPPLTVHATFNAFSFYNFVQTIDVEERFWSEDDYTESVYEMMYQSESQNIDIDSPPDMDPKVVEDVRQWATKTLNDAAQRLMLEALPAENPEDAKKLYLEQDFENVRRDILRYRISNFTLNFNESTTVDFRKLPQGTLPNITTLTDNNGNPIIWSDYAQVVDLDDPFFRQVRADVFVNADFENLPIHSVEVKLNYQGRPMALLGEGPDGEFRFNSPDQLGHFASFVENDNWKYHYSYQVNYLGAAQIYQSPEIETNESILTVNVDDMGILLVDIAPGDLNFAQVSQAQLIMRYEDAANNVNLIEQQFILDKANPTHRFQEVIFTRRAQPYQYRVKYYMVDGKEYEMEWQNGESKVLYINDPFNNTRRIGVRAAGDLENDIDTIFVDLKYNDEANHYTQTTTIALSKRQPFFDWSFPVINETNGVVSYSGTIVYKDTTVQEIPETVTTSSTPLIGEAIQDRLPIVVLADLLDFSAVKLARLELNYQDAANDVLERKEFIFGGTRPKEQSWNLKLKDKTKIDYQWSATYFMNNGSRLSQGPFTSDDLTLILEMPAA